MNQVRFRHADATVLHFVVHYPACCAALLAESHLRSLGARFIELLFDNDVAVNSAGSILHITRRCLGHKSCETTQRYISIKCNGDMPTKIGCVSHVDQSDLTDGSFVVKLYEESSTKRKRKRRRRKRHNKREGDAASAY